MPELNSIPAPPPVSHAHHAPPLRIRDMHKKYQKASISSLSQDDFLLDFSNDRFSEYHKVRLRVTGRIPGSSAEKVFRDFESSRKTWEVGGVEDEKLLGDDILIYEHSSVPGDYSSSAPLHIVGIVSSHLMCFRLLYNPLATPSLHSKIASPPSPFPRSLEPAAQNESKLTLQPTLLSSLFSLRSALVVLRHPPNHHSRTARPRIP